MPENDELAETRSSLIQRLRNWDDQESWRDFFETYWRLIYSVGIRSGLTDQEAQDAVQETIISVCRNIHKFKLDPAKGSFKSWLLKLARWRVIDQVRRRPMIEKSRVHFRDARDSEAGASTATEHRIPDPTGNRLEAVWDEEWERYLTAAALDSLELQVSPTHFKIFYESVIKGRSPASVGEEMGVKVALVYLIRNRLRPLFERALERVRSRVP